MYTSIRLDHLLCRNWTRNLARSVSLECHANAVITCLHVDPVTGDVVTASDDSTVSVWEGSEEAPIVPHFAGMRGVCGPCQFHTICWSWDRRTEVFPFGICKWAGGGMIFMDTHQPFGVLKSKMIWLSLAVETRPCVSGTGHLECVCMCCGDTLGSVRCIASVGLGRFVSEVI